MNGAAVAAARRNARSRAAEVHTVDPELNERLDELISDVNHHDVLQRIDKLDAILDEEEAERLFGLTSGVSSGILCCFDARKLFLKAKKKVRSKKQCVPDMGSSIATLPYDCTHQP
jgi:hypothetical protein